MSEQLKLFEYEGTLNYRQLWELKKTGIEQATADLITLLNEAAEKRRSLPITLYDIAKHRVGLDPSADIPQDYVERIYKIVHQIYDERYRLKSRVEEQTDYRLVCVNDMGESSLKNGRRHTAGFDLRESDVGKADSVQQWKMAKGKMRQIARRSPEVLAEEPEALRRLLQINGTTESDQTSTPVLPVTQE